METSNPTIILAFLGGMASFLSPCVLPMVPIYIGYMGGQAVVTSEQQSSLTDRFSTFFHALAFVIGFSIVFISIGTAIGWLSSLLRSDWVQWIGGLVMIFFGLALIGWIKLPFLYTERRVQVRPRPGWGLFSSLLVGMAFAAGWTPCIGPVLASILALVINQENVAQSIGLLLAYSAGLGLPFLLVGLALNQATTFLKKLHRYMTKIQIATGVFIVIFGIILLMGWMHELGNWMTRMGLGWDLGL